MSSKSISPQLQLQQEDKEKLLREVLDQANNNNLNPFIQAILSHKLDIDQMDSNGYTALHLAVWSSDIPSIFILLDKASCPIDIKSSSGQTPLTLAVAKGYLEIIKLFIDRGADIECKDSLGITPIMTSVQNARLGAFYVLLSLGADIHVKDRNGCGLVHWAAYKNQVLMLRVLKNLDLDLEILDESNMTPLHRAAVSNAVKAVDFLMFNSVKVDKLDLKNRTALDLANENSSEGVINLLTEYSVMPEPIHNYFGYYCICYWIGVYYVYFNHILPETIPNLFASLLFNICIFWLFPLYLLNKFFSANTIETSSINLFQNKTLRQFNRKTFKKLPKQEDYCTTCNAKRPPRSKHCRFTNKCIINYDHFCYFLLKPIGEGNHKMFFIGLLMCFLSSSIFLYLSWYALHYKTGPFQHISTYIISLIIEYFALNGLCKTMIFLACIVNWYLFWYLFIEIYSISSGLTVNETLNLHRYKNFICIDGTRKVQYFNRFNKGFVENWMEFIIN